MNVELGSLVEYGSHSLPQYSAMAPYLIAGCDRERVIAGRTRFLHKNTASDPNLRTRSCLADLHRVRSPSCLKLALAAPRRTAAEHKIIHYIFTETPTLFLIAHVKSRERD
ncbi:hypothetical protein GCM10022280_09340 [Sphingomonas swuensis]|uniref:Uncharacterized protein n=1 Tax=Sphingomonas swuensis TaxID=977800 RepID=A0ABP7SL59_9SPHN